MHYVKAVGRRRPPRAAARPVLMYGESVNPESPHRTDQTELFSRKQWVTERFTEAEIKTSPELEVTRLRGRRPRDR